MRIGELAARTGVSVRSLRYYEERGLLSAARSPSAQRSYDDDAVDRVNLLRQLYRAGLNSATIAALMPCVDAPSTEVTRESVALMEREHARLGRQIEDLVTTRAQLAYLVDAAATHHRDQLAATVPTPSTT